MCFYLLPWFSGGSLKWAGDRDRHFLRKMHLTCLAMWFVTPGTQGVFCKYLCHYTKIDPVSWCHRIKYCCTPKRYWKLPSSSQDALDSTSGLIIFSNLYILEIGEGSWVSSLWALGRLPHSGHSSPRHVMIHLCLLSHTEKDYFALDWCSICSHPFPAKVTISPKENKRCSELFINFCMWNEWGIDVRSPAVMRWWPRWDGMTQKQFLAMSN